MGFDSTLDNWLKWDPFQNETDGKKLVSDKLHACMGYLGTACLIGLE